MGEEDLRAGDGRGAAAEAAAGPAEAREAPRALGREPQRRAWDAVSGSCKVLQVALSFLFSTPALPASWWSS